MNYYTLLYRFESRFRAKERGQFLIFWQFLLHDYVWKLLIFNLFIRYFQFLCFIYCNVRHQEWYWNLIFANRTVVSQFIQIRTRFVLFLVCVFFSLQWICVSHFCGLEFISNRFSFCFRFCIHDSFLAYACDLFFFYILHFFVSCIVSSLFLFHRYVMVPLYSVPCSKTFSYMFVYIFISYSNFYCSLHIHYIF